MTDLPLPPEAWSIFKWSTVICKISAFSSLADPLKVEEKCLGFLNELLIKMSAITNKFKLVIFNIF